MKMFSLRRLMGVLAFILIIFIFINYIYQKYFENEIINNNTQVLKQDKWQRFTSTKDNFSVDFPIFPTTSTPDVSEGNGITYTTYDSVAKNKEEYFVAAYRFSDAYEFKTEENIKDLLNTALNSYINGEKEIIKYSNYSNFMGLIALDSTISSKIKTEGYTINLKYFFTKRNTVYALGALSPYNTKADYDRFINSFKLLQP